MQTVGILFGVHQQARVLMRGLALQDRNNPLSNPALGGSQGRWRVTTTTHAAAPLVSTEGAVIGQLC